MLIGHPNVTDDPKIEYLFPGYEQAALAMHVNLASKDAYGILEVLFDYQVKVFTEKEIDNIFHSMVNILEDVLDNPAKKLSEIQLVSEKDKNQLLYQFNDTKSDFPEKKLLHVSLD